MLAIRPRSCFSLLALAKSHREGEDVHLWVCRLSLSWGGDWLWNICRGWRWPHSWIVAAKSTLGSPPKTKYWSYPSPPMTSVSTCLLLVTPGGSKGTRREDAFTLSPCVLCVSYDEMWGVRGDRVEGHRGPGNTLAGVWMHDQKPADKVCDRKRERRRDGEKEPQEEKSVILMDTFMAWESWLAARLPHY